MAENEQKVKHIIRVANTDLIGPKPIAYALTKIKGVGVNFANFVCGAAKIDKRKKAGLLSDSEVEILNDVVNDPLKYNAPTWMLNRRKDYETGEDKHLLMGKLSFQKDQDIKKLMRIKSNRGLRLSWGLPVRGQRTKSNFRRNKGKGLGVKRKKGKSGRT